jgi:hypothetical protein
MALILKAEKKKDMIAKCYITQHTEELRTHIIIRPSSYAKLHQKKGEELHGAEIVLKEEHTLKLANYFLNILYQCGMIDELDIIKKKSKYTVHDKRNNTDYVKKKSAEEYKNPFKLE